MDEKVILIILRCCMADYSYKVYLCFETQKSARENFEEPLETAKADKGFSGVTTLKIPSGIIEGGRYFKKDYEKGDIYEVKFRNTIISNVDFKFELSEENEQMGLLNIENIIISFKNYECRECDN